MHPARPPGLELLGRYRDSGLERPAYLVRRPDGQVAQVGELSYALLWEADGWVALPELAARAASRSGRPLTAEAAAFLIRERLQPAGLLQLGRETPPSLPRADPLLALRLRIAALPARAVSRIAWLLSPLFRPVVVVATVCFLGGLDVSLASTAPVDAALASLPADPRAVLLVGALAVAAVIAHEFGHATGCRYGGGEPGAIGLGVYVVWPVLYTDLTDTYRLDRRGRLCADAGGIYFSALCAIAAAVAFRATGYRPLLALVVIQHLEIAMQTLPLLRFDGHYIVSDLVGVPDALAKVRPALASLLPGRPEPPAVRALTRRALRLLRLYAAVALPAAAVVLALVVLSAPALLDQAIKPIARGHVELARTWQEHELVAGMAVLGRMLLAALPVAGLLLTAGLMLRRAAQSFAGKPLLIGTQIAHAAMLGVLVLYLSFYVVLGSVPPTGAPAIIATLALVAWAPLVWFKHSRFDTRDPRVRRLRERRGF